MSNIDEIKDRLSRLRALMAESKVDAYIVPTGDFHMSEYLAPYFCTREYITGFTGSAGTAVITAGEAGLWADSRYYLQAAGQLDGTGIDLYKMQEPGVPSITEFLRDKLCSGSAAAFDGRVVSCGTFLKWKNELEGSGISLSGDKDLVGAIWDDRPALPCSQVFGHDIKYAGRSRTEKIADIRPDMKGKGADALFIASLSDILWLLNLRGDDVHCNPVFLSYLLIDENSVRLFAQSEAFSEDLKAELASGGISLEPYMEAGSALASLEAGTSLWLSSAGCSCALRASVPADVRIIDLPEPTEMRKAVKNAVEQEGARNAHIRDAAAVTKWIYWLKNNVGKTEITELSAADVLYSLRSDQELFMGNSFDPIIAYADHAAIVHYSATEETDVPLEARGLLLADTGGQYLDGTTDITRTIALGPVSDEERRMFTAVLRGHIDLAMAVFKEGCSGHNLDILAHLPLWMMSKDYGHGTGHGVGHFLNVHERPNHFHWDMRGSRGKAPAFEPGMITSDEPGFYEAGSFGIRHESLLMCVEHSESEYGRFLAFDEITLVPFDLDAIDADMLTSEEKEYLNAYHAKVFETVSPYLEAGEAGWLKKATRRI